MRKLLLAFLMAGCQTAQPSPQQMVAGLAGPEGVEYFALLRQQADDESARDAIVAGLKSPNVRVRGQCARLLGTRRDVTVVEPLRDLLLDSDPTVRWQAARALVPVVESRELVEWLRSPQMPDASRLVLARAMLVDPAELTEPAFVDWLMDARHPPSFREALYRAHLEFHVVKYGSRRGEQALAGEVRSARQRIATALRSDALDRHKSAEFRSVALQLYGSLGANQAFDDLRAVASREPVGSLTHRGALLALGRTEDPRAVAILRGYAVDRSLPLAVREAAVRGLAGVARNPGTVDALLPLLAAPEPALREAAAMALAGSRDRRVVPALTAALAVEQHGETARRIQASIAHLSRRRRDVRREQD